MKVSTYCTTALIGLAFAAPAARADDNPWYSNATFSVYQDNSDGRFWQCSVLRKQWDSNHLLNIAEGMDSYLSLVITGVSSLVGAGEQTASGSFQVDGGKPSSFENIKLKDSTVKPGEKYMDITVDFSLKDSLSKGRTLTVNLPKGAMKFPLSGASDALQRMDACLDDGAAKEPAAAAAAELAAPDGWSLGKDAGGAQYLSNENPAGAERAGFALVQASPGNFSLRLRSSKTEAERGLDAASASREAASLELDGGEPVSVIMLRQNNDVDIMGLTFAELGRMPNAGIIKVTSLEKGASFAHEFAVGVDLAAAAKAFMASAGVAPALSVAGLQGKYYVRGRNPDGKHYSGDAEATADGQALHITYTWGDGKILKAKGSLLDNLLTTIAEGETNPVVYKIGKDGYWRGTFANGKGVEYLVPK